MIQTCSRCGTRWNVRDTRRTWCPRCRGALLEPSASVPGSEWSARPTASRLPLGYRWIAVRPGEAPARRGRGRLPSPTPRYEMIPRWGLQQTFDFGGHEQTAQPAGPSMQAVRTTLVVTMVVLGVAAFVHVVRYGLLLINRTVLLNTWVAGAATWLGVLASVVAMFSVVASAVMLTNWLIARRSAAFAHLGRVEHRSAWALRAGCLVPLINVVWAPVFVVELAAVEERSAQLRRPILHWWVAFVVSTAVSMFAVATSFTTDAQGIADNTVTTTVAYLLALAALLLATQVFFAFERTAVDRPRKRWVMVAEEADEGGVAPTESRPDAQPDDGGESAVQVEDEGQNPAA